MLDDTALDMLFRLARTQDAWTAEKVGEDRIRAAFDLLRMGPTSANCQPARFVFVVSDEGREMLRPCLSSGNTAKTMSAPVTAIIGYDMEFLDLLPKLYPVANARSWFEGQPALIEETAFRNGTLQGAYFIMACRALGLDCAPMSGFDRAKVDAAFFAGTRIRSNFLCAIGHGDPAAVDARAPRLDFEEACRIV
jgi:3-hydroxypropanoate dehydrogenase